MKYIIAGIRVVLILLNTAYQVSCLAVAGWIKGKTQERSFKHRRKWAQNSCRILGIKVDERIGSIGISPALVISNHRTLLDPVIQAAFVDAFIIAKAEVGNLPIISQGAKMTGIIFVKREKMRSRLAARDKTKEILENGDNVLVYAEGTTGTNRTSNKFKVGTFSIAAELNLPVIPIAIDYPLRKDYWFETSMTKQIFGQIGSWNTHVKVRVGDPIYGSDAKQLMADVQSTIDTNLLAMQQGWSKVFDELPSSNSDKS